MLLKCPFVDAERHSTSLNGYSTSLNGHSASMNEDLILLNIEKQIGAATFSVEHLCL